MKDNPLVLLSGLIAVGVSTFIIARILLSEEERSAAQENLADLRDRKASNRLVKFTRPFFTQYVVPMVRNKPIWDNARTLYRRKLVTAGLREELTPDEFIAFKFVLILFFPIVGFALNAAGLTDFGWYTILGSGVAGYYYPDFWANRRIRIRQEAILKSMPFIVDLLALSTEAGLDFVGAIQKVVDKTAPGPLVDEFAQVMREIRLGSSRAQALREMSLRVNMLEVNSFIAILISADQMGASISKTLKQQSDSMRVERLMRAEKAGAAAASKVLLPLVLLILPAVLILIFAPVVVPLLPGGQVKESRSVAAQAREP